MSSVSYWERKLTRRRALRNAGLVGIGSAAVALIGCGDDGDGEQTTGSGLLTPREDTRSKAVPGGILPDYNANDVDQFDPLSGTPVSRGASGRVYSLLLKRKLVTGPTLPADNDVLGDVAESWEMQPDGLQITMKLRQNMKFDPRPPTSSRPIDAEDVVWSWEKFKSLSIQAPNVATDRDPNAPVKSITQVDSRTVVVKLDAPYAPILGLLAHDWFLILQPREGDGKVDLRRDPRGTGPFRLKQYNPSVSFEFEKNADWYETGKPFVDGMTKPIILEYAQGLAQFEAGNIFTYPVRPDEQVSIKRKHPDMVFGKFELPGTTRYGHGFSAQPNSPFLDVRVRRAASMVIDRDAWIAALYGTDNFEKEGVPVSTYWQSHLWVTQPNWKDPRSSDFGEASQFFKYDVAEARKLLSAAGYANSPFPVSYVTSGAAGRIQRNLEGQPIIGMWRDSGLFNPQDRGLDYANEFNPQCQFSKGLGYEGICQNWVSFFNELNELSGRYTPTGTWAVAEALVPDRVRTLIRGLRSELDSKKQASISLDLQRELATAMPDLPLPGAADTFALNWPWVQNYGVFRQPGSAQAEAYYWIDNSKKKAS